MEGGLIRDVLVDKPVSLIVVDYDCEGSDPDKITHIPQFDRSGGEVGTEEALVFRPPQDDSVPEQVAQLMALKP